MRMVRGPGLGALRLLLAAVPPSCGGFLMRVLPNSHLGFENPSRVVIPENHPSLGMPEKALQEAVLGLADLLGYAAYHTFDSRRSSPGFPDVVLAGRDRIIFAELKSHTGRITKAQERWLRLLADSGGEVYLWRPRDWLNGSIETILRVGDVSHAVDPNQLSIEGVPV